MSARATHIGLNLIFLVPGETGGMEVYARELIPALLAEAPAGTRFTAFVNREAAAAGGGPWGELLPAVTVPVNARNRVAVGARRAGAAAARWPRERASTWCTAWPAPRPCGVASAGWSTVHDLIYARFPDAHPGIRDRGMRLLVPAAARRSDRVIADSQSTREDLIELLGRPRRARSTSCPSGSASCAPRQPLPSARHARAWTSASGEVAAEPLGQASPQEPRAP